jgi:hypothetical protein
LLPFKSEQSGRRLFRKLPELHKRQFVQSASGASFYFQMRLRLVCELAGASTGRLLDCPSGTGEITCALDGWGLKYREHQLEISRDSQLQHLSRRATNPRI